MAVTVFSLWYFNIVDELMTSSKCNDYVLSVHGTAITMACLYYSIISPSSPWDSSWLCGGVSQ